MAKGSQLVLRYSEGSPELTRAELIIMVNLPIQVSANPEYLPLSEKSKKSKHKEGYFSLYYQKNKQKYLLANQKYRSKKQPLKPFKSLSQFQQKKTHQLLRILVNYRSFVPVPPKLKHPIIKN
jgi:hypothetical protein